MKKQIPIKNYIILLVIAVATVLLTLYIREWIETYRENKISVSPLSGNINEINTNELELTLNESNQIIIYVSYVNDSNIYNKERKLLKKIKSKQLSDYIIYYNVTDLLDGNEYLNILKSKFSNLKTEFIKAPMFIYVKNGEAVEVINSDDEIVNVKELEQLIKKYEIGE